MSKRKDLTTTGKQKIKKFIEILNVHLGDIKGALQRSSNDKEVF